MKLKPGDYIDTQKMMPLHVQAFIDSAHQQGFDKTSLVGQIPCRYLGLDDCYGSFLLYQTDTLSFKREIKSVKP